MDDSRRLFASKLETLTDREIESLRGITKGETAKMTARRLNVGHRAIENYRYEAARKLGVRPAARAAWLLAECERNPGVELHPVSADAGQPETLDATNGPPAITTGDQVSPDQQLGNPVGRRVKLSVTWTLLLILAWGLGFGIIAVAAAYLYHINL